MKASPVTRRRVLQTFGSVGGSSLVMGAMNAWGLMGVPAGTRPILQGRAPGTRVVVLGAGVSGLTVGYELGKLGYDYQILEARDWVGGLCWTVRRGASHQEIDGERQVCQFDEGQYLNAGAWRIPNADTGVLGYCKELGVPLEIFINTSDANYFYDERDALGPIAHRKVRLRDVRADLWGSTAELLAKAMDQGGIDAPLTVADEELLLDFLVSAGYLDSEDHAYQPPASRGATNRLDLGALLRSGFGNRAGPLYAGIGGPDPVFQPIGGMMQIPLAFQRAIGDHITLEAEVSSLERAAHRGRRRCRLPGDPERCDASDHRGLLRLLSADGRPATDRHRLLGGHGPGSEGGPSQRRGKAGSADEATVLGRGRGHFRRSSLGA